MVFENEVKRRARRMTRDEVRDDMEMLLQAVYHGECTQDKELSRESEKELRKTEKVLVYQTFYEK